jgi:hypothetical protein
MLSALELSSITSPTALLKFALFDKPRVGKKHRSNYQNKREIKKISESIESSFLSDKTTKKP